MIDIDKLTIKDLHQMYNSKQVTVKEVINLFSKRIQEKNSEINAYIEIFTDIDKYIDKAQEMIDTGNANFLTGVPVAIKDNMLYKGHKVSAGSKILEGYIAPYSSPVVEKLLECGSIIMGRTNMDEFAMGSSTETSAYGNTLNPLDNTRVPGGSSGGSAAAVAMGGALLAIGSDTGGSIRQPAAFCGIVGMKPTYGMVSRYGLIAMASSLDQIGPFTKNCIDAEIAFNLISFDESHDSTLIPEKERDQLKKNLGKKIGIPYSFIKEGVDSDISEAFNATVDGLKKTGYEIVDIDLPLTPLSLAVYYILMPAEVSSNLARFDGVRYGNLPSDMQTNSMTDFYKKVRTGLFGREVRRRSILGAFILSHGYYDAYYNKARKLKMAITNEFNNAFKDVDAILLPTTPTTAFKIGERSESPLSMYLADLFTAPANIAGLPAISVPVPGSILPVGIQIITPKGNDEHLFTIGREIEGLI
jgi:aspartyl-tRNA(Asn)/glutamyl-tRNA(Gln) amidotransferase subunit A